MTKWQAIGVSSIIYNVWFNFSSAPEWRPPFYNRRVNTGWMAVAVEVQFHEKRMAVSEPGWSCTNCRFIVKNPASEGLCVYWFRQACRGGTAPFAVKTMWPVASIPHTNERADGRTTDRQDRWVALLILTTMRCRVETHVSYDGVSLEESMFDILSIGDILSLSGPPELEHKHTSTALL